jgi:hypothetical protein
MATSFKDSSPVALEESNCSRYWIRKVAVMIKPYQLEMSLEKKSEY